MLENGYMIVLDDFIFHSDMEPLVQLADIIKIDFRKEPIYDIIRNNSSLSANEILNAMIETLKSFQKGAKIEDDITLVIIKIID